MSYVFVFILVYKPLIQEIKIASNGHKLLKQGEFDT